MRLPQLMAGRRSSLPASLPRPVKLTRGRTDAVPPPAHIRVLGGTLADRDRDNISRKLGMKLGKFASSIERITVRLSDANGPKGGPDQICQIKIVLSGLPSVVVQARAPLVQSAVEAAMKAAAVAARRSIERRLKQRYERTVATASG